MGIKSLLKKPNRASSCVNREIRFPQNVSKYRLFSEQHFPAGLPEGLNQQALKPRR
jgi:hypothetical protein